MKYLSEAILNHFGPMAGLDTWDGVVIKWPYAVPQPSPEELEAIRLAYELSVEAQEGQTALEQSVALLLKLSNPTEQKDIALKQDLIDKLGVK